MAFQLNQDQITPAESTRHSWELEQQREDRQFQMDLADKNIQVALIENKWNALFKVPIAIIRLPVYVVMAVGYCIAMARGKDVAEDFWRFIEK